MCVSSARAFSGCTSLSAYTLPAGVTALSRSLFYGCTSLATVTLHGGVTSVGQDAFEGCSSLVSLDLPDSVVVENVHLSDSLMTLSYRLKQLEENK